MVAAKSPRRQAALAVRAIGERVAQADPVIAAKRTKLQERLRKDLAEGTVNGTLNHHALALAIRFLPGGRRTFVEFVDRARLNGDPEARAWWTVYADLNPAEQTRVDLDDVCEASGVRPDTLMGVVVSTAMRMGSDVADLIAATAHPSIVRRTVKSAMRIGGAHAEVAQRDRIILLQNQKFAPIPKGTSVHVHASAKAQAAAAASAHPSAPRFSDAMDGAMAAHRQIQQPVEGEVTEDPADV